MNVQVLSKQQIWVIVFAILSVALVTSGCSQSTSAADPAPGVEVVEVQQKDVPIYGEWIGTLEGMVNADIKAQVTGYLLKQGYTEGSFVRKGQLLFEIDARPFQAAVAQAQGQLAQANAQFGQAQAQLAVAQANQGRTQLDVDRYIPLAKQQAITQQELDNATQNNLAAKAQMQAAKAAVETAKAQIQAANATVQASQ